MVATVSRGEIRVELSSRHDRPFRFRGRSGCDNLRRLCNGDLCGAGRLSVPQEISLSDVEVDDGSGELEFLRRIPCFTSSRIFVACSRLSEANAVERVNLFQLVVADEIEDDAPGIAVDRLGSNLVDVNVPD